MLVFKMKYFTTVDVHCTCTRSSDLQTYRHINNDKCMFTCKWCGTWEYTTTVSHGGGTIGGLSGYSSSA